MKKLLAVILLVLSVILPGTAFVGCTQVPSAEDVQGKVYVYEKDGFGGAFTLSIEEGGKMSYYEGALSSHIGLGSWTLADGILTISEDNGRGGQRVNRFAVDGDSLTFMAEASDNFIYLKLESGARFSPIANVDFPFHIEESE